MSGTGVDGPDRRASRGGSGGFGRGASTFGSAFMGTVGGGGGVGLRDRLGGGVASTGRGFGVGGLSSEGGRAISVCVRFASGALVVGFGSGRSKFSAASSSA